MKEDFIKIINQTYRLIDFFPDADPLKTKAKERALAILENLTLMSNVEGWISLKKEKAVADLLDNIEVLESYLKLAKHQGWIDGINFLIITKEYHQIRSKVDAPKGLIRETIKIATEVKDQVLAVAKEQSTQESVKKPLGNKQADVKFASKDFSERQKKILEMLSNRDKVQVADIIKEIPKVTKRTIRRDLDDLLKKSKVIRVGEWNQVFYTIDKGSSDLTQAPKWQHSHFNRT